MNLKKIDLWCIVAPIVMMVICLITKTGWLQIITSVTGVIYISLIAKENKYGYLFAVTNVILYAILTWQRGLFGTAVFNIAYSLPILVYGYIFWNKNQGKNKGNIKRMNNNDKVKVGVAGILTIMIYYFIALYVFKINNAFVDAIIVAFSFIGNVLMAKKYIEQWYVFICLNIINIVFWGITAITDTNFIALIAMYIIYLINNVIGVFAWKNKINS